MKWTAWCWWETSKTGWPSWWTTWPTPAAPSATLQTSQYRCRADCLYILVYVKFCTCNRNTCVLVAFQANWCWSGKSLRHPHARHFLRPRHLSHQQRPVRGRGGYQHHPTGREDEGVPENTGARSLSTHKQCGILFFSWTAIVSHEVSSCRGDFNRKWLFQNTRSRCMFRLCLFAESTREHLIVLWQICHMQK